MHRESWDMSYMIFAIEQVSLFHIQKTMREFKEAELFIMVALLWLYAKLPWKNQSKSHCFKILFCSEVHPLSFCMEVNMDL